MRKVGRTHDVRDTHQVEHSFEWFLVALDGDETLPLEVLARLLRQVAREDVTEPFVVFVHPPEKEGHSARVALEEREAQPRMALKDPAAAEAHGCEHLLAQVADSVAEHHVPREAVPDLRQLGAQAFVEAERHVEGFELATERLIVRIGPLRPLTGLGRRKMPLKPSSFTGAALLRPRRRSRMARSCRPNH